MKILIIVASHGMGGLEKHCIELSNGLVKRKNIDVIFAGHGFYKEHLSPNINFQEINLSGSRHNPFTLIALYRIIQAQQPDIIHAQANKAGYLLANLKPFITAKTLLTVHGYKKRFPTLKAFNHVIAVSKKALSKVNYSQSSVIYNGIPPFQGQAYSKTEICDQFNLDVTKPLFVAVGRLAPVKQFHKLIQHWPEKKANLLIIGGGELQESLTKLTEQAHKDKYIKLNGPRDDIEAILPGCDICVFSSEREGFPYVFIESLLSKTPVISTPVSDFPDILPKDALSKSDLSDFSQLVENWSDNLDSLLNDYQDVFLFAQDNLTLDKMLNHHLDIYSNISTTSK